MKPKCRKWSLILKVCLIIIREVPCSFILCISAYLFSCSFRFLDVEQKVARSVDWLKIYRTPWEDVVSHWGITFNFRRKSIEKCEGGKVHLLLEQWPILKQPNGFLLIERDFDAMNLTKVVITNEIHNIFCENVRAIQPLNDRDANAACLYDLLLLEGLTGAHHSLLQLLSLVSQYHNFIVFFICSTIFIFIFLL